jgi:hypothetical protein
LHPSLLRALLLFLCFFVCFLFCARRCWLVCLCFFKIVYALNKWVMVYLLLIYSHVILIVCMSWCCFLLPSPLPLTLTQYFVCAFCSLGTIWTPWFDGLRGCLSIWR